MLYSVCLLSVSFSPSHRRYLHECIYRMLMVIEGFPCNLFLLMSCLIIIPSPEVFGGYVNVVFNDCPIKIANKTKSSLKIHVLDAISFSCSHQASFIPSPHNSCRRRVVDAFLRKWRLKTAQHATTNNQPYQSM